MVFPQFDSISEGRRLASSRMERRACSRTFPWSSLRDPRVVRAGFTLIEVLVSIAVIAVLLGLLVPGLNKAHEAARRVACAQNLRQLGFGISSYAEANKDRIPPTGFLPSGWGGRSNNPTGSPEQMLIVRVADRNLAYKDGILWDGLGRLFFAGHLAPGTNFYCPSHRGNHPQSRYLNLWGASKGEIVSNYQYRGMGNGQSPSPKLFQIEPINTALAVDGMRSKPDYNHRIGVNVLRVDLGIEWISDPGGVLGSFLPDDEDENDGSNTNNAWDWIDDARSSNTSE